MKRRNFLKNTMTTTAGAIIVPTIVPSTVFGKTAPSNKIQLGQIGCGRIAISHDMAELLKYDQARYIAVCDLDKNRKEAAKKRVENVYNKQTGSDNAVDVKMYDDYREMLLNKDIDAVAISTPDHWHS